MSETADEIIALPQPKRAAWLVVVLVGGALALLGGAAVVDDVLAGFGTAPPLAYLGFGAGLFLTGFGAIFLINRDKAEQLRLEGEHLFVRCLDGSEVRVPLTSLAKASCRMGGNRSFVAVLHKRDGGVIELCACSDEASAQAISEPIQRRVEALAHGEPQGGSDPDPLERLEGLAHVRASRTGDALELCWSGSGATALWLALFGPLTGMGFIVLGFHIGDPSLGTLVAIAFVGLLMALTLWSILRQVGITQRLRIDGRELSVERLRGSKTLSRKAAPIFSVVAVDYTHQLQVVGGQLLIRLRAAQDALESMEAEAERSADEDAASALALAGGVLHLLGNTEVVPTGPLTLSERLAVDLALSEELARRSGRLAGTL